MATDTFTSTATCMVNVLADYRIQNVQLTSTFEQAKNDVNFTFICLTIVVNSFNSYQPWPKGWPDPNTLCFIMVIRIRMAMCQES